MVKNYVTIPALVGEDEINLPNASRNEKITFAYYFRASCFPCKITKKGEAQCIYRTGDNIYKPKCPIPFDYDDFEQLCNPNHNEGHKEDDLRGKFVLVSQKFHYFGKKAMKIPRHIRPKIPKCCAKGGWQTHDQTLAQNFINSIDGGWDWAVYAPTVNCRHLRLALFKMKKLFGGNEAHLCSNTRITQMTHLSRAMESIKWSFEKRFLP